jgi:D-glycero-D-manno-heptose 1,7-bisphosphate phosphatase
MTGLRPAIFLDKDGTLLQNVPFNADPARMRWAPGAPAALAMLGALAVPLFVVTNQAGIARGLLREADMDVIERELRARFASCGAALAGYYFCPHAPADDGGERCDCRKPLPGMLVRAAAEHGIALASSWMVGDILDDVEAGRRAGCRTILVDNGNETQWRLSPERIAHARVPTLDAAARVIVSACGGERMPSRRIA